jgi:flagellar hook-basal body complex protein FliE
MDPVRDIINRSPLPGAFTGKEKGTRQTSFKETLQSLISEVDTQIKDADQKAQEFALGKKHDLHEIIIASEKADISLRFLIQIRNKLLEAYQEIMRMSF